ncbi:MAG: hypothetical protein RLZZ241_763 [Bacteroidota bacterium]
MTEPIHNGLLKNSPLLFTGYTVKLKCKKPSFWMGLKVQMGRLELPNLTALEPETSVSTNSTTSAYASALNPANLWFANLVNFKKCIPEFEIGQLQVSFSVYSIIFNRDQP